MNVSTRTVLAIALGGFGLILSVMLPNASPDIGVVDAAYPDAPPLHAPVPTAPFPSHG